MTFHQFKEEGVIYLVECLRQIDGTKVSRTAASDITINNVADCADSKTTSNAFLKSKLIIRGRNKVIIPIKNTIFENF